MPKMQEWECKLCYAPIDPSEAKNGVVRCKFCGHSFTLPKSDSAAVEFIRMGEHDLDSAKFDEAYSAFKRAASMDKNEPEAYFGMALSECKVRFIHDEANNRLQPVCHGFGGKKFTDSRNFNKAVELASDEQRLIYKVRGEEIDYIKTEFESLKNRGADYDCFICVKVTDGQGERTADYKRADDIYFALRGKGYKPFFSEREITNRSGRDYEAMILYALYTSKCMIVVCGDEEYLATPWVKNEYSRFIELMAGEEKESDAITVAFSGLPIERLPGRNGKIQGIDLNAIDAIERITAFVNEHVEGEQKRTSSVKFCTDCGAENPESVKFCGECGGKTFVGSTKELIAYRNKKEKTASGEVGATETKAGFFGALKKNFAAAKSAVASGLNQAKESIIGEMQDLGFIEKRKKPLSEYTDFKIEGTVMVDYYGYGGEVVIPDGVTHIAVGSFHNCRKDLVSLVIPSSVISIDNHVFNDCFALRKVTMPKKLKKFAKKAFTKSMGYEGNLLKQITFTYTK